MKVSKELVDETIVSYTLMKDGQVAEVISCIPDDIYSPGDVLQRVGTQCVQLGQGSDSCMPKLFNCTDNYEITVKILRNGTRLEVVNN